MGTHIAGVADPVAVGVGLIGVGDQRTVVDVAAAPVVIGVIRGVVGAHIAGVADPVAVGVGLAGVGDQRAVIEAVDDIVAVAVAVAFVRVRGATGGSHHGPDKTQEQHPPPHHGTTTILVNPMMQRPLPVGQSLPGR